MVRGKQRVQHLVAISSCVSIRKGYPLRIEQLWKAFFARRTLGRDLRAEISEKNWPAVLDICSDRWRSEPDVELALTAYKAAVAMAKFELAEDWLDRGIQLQPDWRLIYFRADKHRRQGEWGQARDIYEQAIELAPHRAEPRALLGRMLMSLGEFESASSALRSAISRSKQPKAAWFMHLGISDAKLGRLEDAKEALARSYALEPKQNLKAMIADIERRIELGSNTTEATAGFYDDTYSAENNYNAPWRESVYAPVWLAIGEILEEHRPTTILDLGCGPGQFAHFISEGLPAAKYHGVDFSAVAVDIGRNRFPHFQFSELKLPVESYRQFEPFDVVICTEVLEHIEADIDVLQPISPGTLVVFSVPNFDSFGHVRIFKSSEEVSSRYAYMFDGLSIIPVALANGSILWLGNGRKAS
jgi:tetratricopeptide (TPR) repeat protein